MPLCKYISSSIEVKKRKPKTIRTPNFPPTPRSGSLMAFSQKKMGG